MKILCLRGRNLASLESEFVIDFRQEPLASAGIFAITGSTGAGKSTLLDAICLALYGKAPRTEKVGENVAIADIADKSIQQDDARNILRRGAVEGFAELEFKALNGDVYRSRWSVRRARNKVNGALQAVEMSLHNLTKGYEEQGKFTEIRQRIEALVGLTFVQFTRAVLLAQGDFATFLKARQSEKAELLEKLTGTEIYSQISRRVYEHTKQAENEVMQIRTQMSDVTLLSADELSALQDEQTKLTSELQALRRQEKVLSEQKIWLSAEQKLRQALSEGKAEHELLLQAMEDAQPRIRFVGKVEAVQEIIPLYQQIKENTQSICNTSEAITKTESDLQQTQLACTQTDDECEQVKQLQAEWEAEQQELQPQMEQARIVDVEISSWSERLAEEQKLLAANKEQIQRYEKEQQQLHNELKHAEESIQTLEIFFEQKAYLRSVVEAFPRLQVQIRDYQEATTQASNLTQQIAQQQALLTTRRKALEADEEALQQLQSMYSSEVILLRKKLQEGMPCPVCGSNHHPLRGQFSQEESLHEEQIEKEKETLLQHIDTKRKQIELGEKECLQMQSICTLAHQRAELLEIEIAPSLEGIDTWREHLKANRLVENLQKTVQVWNNRSEQLQTNKELQGKLQTALQYASQNFMQAQIRILEQEKIHEQVDKELEERKIRRKQLLNGQSVQMVAEASQKRYKHLQQLWQQAHEKRQKLIAEKASLTGRLEQLNNALQQTQKQNSEFTAKMENWLISNSKGIRQEELAELIEVDSNQLATERSYLNNLTERLTETRTRLAERQKQLDDHLHLPIGQNVLPATELEETLQFIDNQIQRYAEQLTGVQLRLQRHNEDVQKVSALALRLQDKEQKHLHWAKLNELLGSADGGKFKTIAQAYTLDVLLLYANKQLHLLTKRYRLQRIAQTLALQVVDDDMMGEVRSVHTLSGGESFLISLALALGLSSLSSNRMRIESLFIDEGFGSLDVDTLNTAMDALENLQTQGRKIGVISHVTEMTERIKTQIRVTRTANGKSKVEIAG